MEVVMDGVPAALVGADLILEPQAARHCVVRPLGRPQQEGGLLALDALSVSLGQRPGLKSPESVRATLPHYVLRNATRYDGLRA